MMPAVNQKTKSLYEFTYGSNVPSITFEILFLHQSKCNNINVIYIIYIRDAAAIDEGYFLIIRFYRKLNIVHLNYTDICKEIGVLYNRSIVSIKEKELIHICIFDTIIKHIYVGTHKVNGSLSGYRLYTFRRSQYDTRT